MLVAEPPTFATRLKQFREAAGITQYRLSQISGVTKQTLSQLEKGNNQPSWDTVQKLAIALGVSVASFATIEPGETPEQDEPATPGATSGESGEDRAAGKLK